MSISSNLFLYENNPQKNLEILSNFSVSIDANTSCTTEKAYKLLPKSNRSPDTLREICIVSSGFTALTIPFLFLAKKVYECGSLLYDGKLAEFDACRSKILEDLAKPEHILTYVSLLSFVAVLGAGAYAAARVCFQDKMQEERFKILDREYSAVAGHLENQYRTAGKEEKEKIVETALKLSDKKQLIFASLLEVGKLSIPQTTLLAAKISQAAQSIILKEERSGAPKNRTGERG